MINTVYKTNDGTEFNSEEMARAHEETLFGQWLDSNPQIDLKAFVSSLDDSEKNEWYCTEYSVVHGFLFNYYHNHVR